MELPCPDLFELELPDVGCRVPCVDAAVPSARVGVGTDGDSVAKYNIAVNSAGVSPDLAVLGLALLLVGMAELADGAGAGGVGLDPD
jgi:hypothetical protein